MTRSCPECGRTWTDRATFCGGCGAALSPAPQRRAPARRTGGGSGAGSTPGPRHGVAAGVVVLLTAAAVVWAVGPTGPRPPTIDEGASEPGVVDLPSPGVETSTPSAGEVPLELVATCQGSGAPAGCVRWVQPGPRSAFGGGAPVTRTTDGDVVVVGDADKVRGLDLATGAPRWTAVASGGTRVVQMADDTTVLVQDADGVRALDVFDGDVRWSAAGATLLSQPRHGPAAPVALLGSPTDDVVTARDPTDGTVRWTLRSAGMPMTVVPLAGDRLLVGPVVVDAATGEVAWDARRLGDGTVPVAATPVVAASTRVLTLEGGEGDVRPVLRDAADGRRVVALDLDPASVQRATVVGDHLVLQTGAAMVAVRLSDGREQWRREDRRGVLLAAPPATGPYPGLPGVAVPAPGLAVRQADGTVLVIDEASGRTRHRLTGPDPDGVDLGGGMVADDRVFRIDDGRLEVFDLATGALLVDATIRSPEVVSTSPLVVLTAGRLVRLDPPSPQ